MDLNHSKNNIEWIDKVIVQKNLTGLIAAENTLASVDCRNFPAIDRHSRGGAQGISVAARPIQTRQG